MNPFCRPLITDSKSRGYTRPFKSLNLLTDAVEARPHMNPTHLGQIIPQMRCISQTQTNQKRLLKDPPFTVTLCHTEASTIIRSNMIPIRKGSMISKKSINKQMKEKDHHIDSQEKWKQKTPFKSQRRYS